MSLNVPYFTCLFFFSTVSSSVLKLYKIRIMIKDLHENSVINAKGSRLFLDRVKRKDVLAVLEFDILFILDGDFGWEWFKSFLEYLIDLK